MPNKLIYNVIQALNEHMKILKPNNGRNGCEQAFSREQIPCVSHVRYHTRNKTEHNFYQSSFAVVSTQVYEFIFTMFD